MPQVPKYGGGAPTVSPQAGPAPFMSIDITADAFGASIGRGLSLLGEGLEGIVKLQRQDQLERQNFNAADYAIKLDAWTSQTMADRARKAAGTDAYGYTTQLVKDWEAEGAKTYASITDPQLKRQWQIRMAQQKTEVFKNAYKTEWEIRDKTTQGQLSRGQDILLKKIEDNPDQFEKIVEEGNGLFDRIPLASNEAKTEYKRLWRERAQLVLAHKGINSGDADAVSRATGGDNDYSRFVRSKESRGSGDLSAKNPNSSARGRYQWIDKTWRGLVNSPAGQAAGLTMDGRGNAEQEEKAFQIFTKQNADYLTKQGINPTNGNLYMAHFLGAGGATEFINAMKRNPNALAKDVMPAAAADNKEIFYRTDARGRLVTDEDGNLIPRTLLQVYENRTRGAGGASYNPRYDSLETLPFAQRTQIRAAAEQRTVVDQQNQVALVQAQETLLTQQMTLAATQGLQTKVTLDQAVANGQISTYENYKKINDAIEKFTGSMESYNRGMEIVSGRRQPNPFSKEDRDGVDAVYNKAPKETRWQTGADMTSKYRIAPPTFAGELQAAIMGNNPETKARALGIAGRILDGNASAFAGVPHAQEAIVEPAIKFWNAVGRGESSAQALAGVNDFLSPDFKAGSPVRNEAAKEFVKTLSSTDPKFTKMLDATYWFTDIARAANATVPLGQSGSPQYRPRVMGPVAETLYADYRDLAEKGFQTYGNSDEAIAYAELRLKNLYGVVGGTVMRLPPLTYPLLNGTHDWVPRQAASNVNQRLRETLGIEAGVTERDVALVPIRGQTKEALDNPEKGPPAYYVWYKRMIDSPNGPYPIFDYMMNPDGTRAEWVGMLPSTGPMNEGTDEAVRERTRTDLMRRLQVGPGRMTEEEFNELVRRQGLDRVDEPPDFSGRSPTPRMTRTPPGTMQRYEEAPDQPEPPRGPVDRRPGWQGGLINPDSPLGRTGGIWPEILPGGPGPVERRPGWLGGVVNPDSPLGRMMLRPPPAPREGTPRSSRNVPRVPGTPPPNRRGPR